MTLWQMFKKHFGAGLLVLGPLYLTFLFLELLIRQADRFVVNPLFLALPLEIEASFKIFLTKLAIGCTVVAFVLIIGLLAERFLFKRIWGGLEALVGAIPIFNRVYWSIKDIATAFFGDKTGVFKRAVFLEYPRKGLWALAFVTQEKRWEIHEKTGQDMVSVFVPSPPNPATGNFVFVPRQELIEADMSIEDAIKLVISGGAAVPPVKAKKQ